MWPDLEATAHTLVYGAACLADGQPPRERLAKITQPTLVATGTTLDPHMAGRGTVQVLLHARSDDRRGIKMTEARTTWRRHGGLASASVA
jgi:hypothetical protein